MIKKFIFILAIIFFLSVEVSATNINVCQTINSGGVYVLINNLTSAGSCLIINADNVDFSCAGYWLNGSGTGNGIEVFGTHTNVTIRDCGISRYLVAVRVSNVFGSDNPHQNILVKNNTIVRSGVGIMFYNANNSAAINNSINHSVLALSGEIWLSSTDSINITGNRIYNATKDPFNPTNGIWFEWQNNNTIVDRNTFTNITGNGISAEIDSENLTISNNIVNGVTLDAYKFVNSNNVVFNNNIAQNSNVSLSLSSLSNFFSNNSILTPSTSSDIELVSSTPVTFVNTSLALSKLFFLGGSSNASVDKYVRAKVQKSSGVGISNAVVNITNATGSSPQIQNAVTDSFGYTASFLLHEFDGNGTVNNTYSPYNVTARLEENYNSTNFTTSDGTNTLSVNFPYYLQCGDALSGIVSMYNNVSQGAFAACFVILNPNVVLDCRNHNITGSYLDVAGITMWNHNISVKNCDISNFGYGIIYFGDLTNGTINNITIRTTFTIALLVAASNMDVQNINIVNASGKGVYMEGLPYYSADPTYDIFRNIVINTTGNTYAVQPVGYHHIFDNVKIYGNSSSALYLGSSANVTFNNTIINANTTYDLHQIDGAAPNYFVNSTINESKLSIAGSRLAVFQYFLDTNVTNSTLGNVVGAAVKIVNSQSGTNTYTTASSGLTGYKVVSAFSYNNLGKTNYTTYMNASHSSYPNLNSTFFNLTQSQTTTMTLSSNILVRAASNQTVYNASNDALFWVNVTSLNGTAYTNALVNLTLMHPNTTIIQTWSNLSVDSDGFVQVVYTFSNTQANGSYMLNATAFNTSLQVNTTSNTSNFTIQPSYSFINSPTIQSVSIETGTTQLYNITLTIPTTGGFANQNLTIYQLNDSAWAIPDFPSNFVIVGTSNITTVNISAALLPPGVYAANITFYDPAGNVANRTTNYTITVTAGSSPNLVINTSSVVKAVNRATNYTMDVILNNSGGGAALGVACVIVGGQSFVSVAPTSVGALAAGDNATLTIVWNMTNTTARGAYSSSLICNNSAGTTSYTTSISTSVQAPSLMPFPVQISKTRSPGDIDTCSASNPNLPCFNIQNNGELSSSGTNCTATGAYSSWVTSISPSSFTLSVTDVQTIIYSIAIPAGIGSMAVTIPIICSSSNYADNATMNLNLGVNAPAPVVPGGGGASTTTVFGDVISVTPNTFDVAGNAIVNPLQATNNGCFTYHVKNEGSSIVTVTYDFDPSEQISENGNNYKFADIIQTDPKQPFEIKPGIVQDLSVCIHSNQTIDGVLITNMNIKGTNEAGGVGIKPIKVSITQSILGLNFGEGNIWINIIIVVIVLLVLFFFYRLFKGQVKVG